MNRSITIATPCFDESESLPVYFQRITDVRAKMMDAGWVVEHLLIDDGSRDNTAEMLDTYARKHPNVRVIRHPHNFGYGGAIKTALALSKTDWVVFVDADTNYDQRLILKLIERIGPEIDIINVSILAPGGAAGYPWYRLVLSSIASTIYRVLLPRLTRGIYTMTCGFRVYRREVVPKIFPNADDFVATSEILVRALQHRLRILEFPATNSRREQGVSKMRGLRVSLRHLSLTTKALTGMLAPPAAVETHLQRIGFHTT